jgi:branched-subunit amino acid ABC-type transport system permease component
MARVKGWQRSFGATRPVASDFSHAFALGAAIAAVSGVLAVLFVPPAHRKPEAGGLHH